MSHREQCTCADDPGAMCAVLIINVLNLMSVNWSVVTATN